MTIAFKIICFSDTMKFGLFIHKSSFMYGEDVILNTEVTAT